MKTTFVRAGILGVAAAAMLALSPGRAEAVILAPNSTAVPPDILFPGGNELDSVYYVVPHNGAYAGTMASAVLRNAAGTLDFYYQVSVTEGPDDLRRVSTSSFANGQIWITDVYEIIDGSNVPCAACPGGFFVDGNEDASNADRSENARVVGFNYTPPGATALNPGETTLVLLVRTNATEYEPGRFSIINGETESRDAFQPAQVPEPASLALLSLGLLGSAAFMRRRAGA